MLHGKIDTEGLEFEAILADVSELNHRAMKAELHMTKLSYHAFAYCSNDYVLLDAGSALGNNCGPLLIAKQPLTTQELEESTVAIPGKYTTANFLFSLAYPNVKHKEALLFSEIEHAILKNEVKAGVIIHENRFTYQDKGLIRLLDLGEFWEANYHMPIPLGGIAVKRDLPLAIQMKINRIMQKSVAYAFEHPGETMPYVSKYAQEMDKKVMQQHIDLYVNKWTLDLGREGRQAIQTLFAVALEHQIIPAQTKDLFL
jgi:1,4-dihydroxy-6-naphthoate synthase